MVCKIAFGSAAFLWVSRSEDDVGYEQLFADVLEEADSVPLSFSGNVPSFLEGTFAQTGPARWTWGDRSMTHVLDGFSKMHKWEFVEGGRVLFTSKFLQSGFFQEAQQIEDIPVGVLAQPTDPPLDVGMKKFMQAPNDNNQVNVFELGSGNLEVLSDTLTLVELDRETLKVTNEYNFMQCDTNVPDHCTVTKNVTLPLGQMNSGASAHPFKTAEGDYIGLREMAEYVGLEPGKEGFAVYRIRKDQRDSIEDIVTIKVKKTSYTHSFGLTREENGMHAVVCAQPIIYNPLAIATSGTLQKGLVKGKDQTARFYVAPLEPGAKAIELDAPDKIFFGHVVNSYSPAHGQFIIDINKQHNIFFDRYSLDVQRDKAKRDSWPTTAVDGVKPGYQTVTRYHLDTLNKTVTSEPLFGHEVEVNVFNEHDLFKLHPADEGKPYCGYWAWQAFYNSTSFASWAVVRTELCGADGPRVAAAWHRPSVYPGEASFVPKPGSSDKTEGAMVFHAFDGNSGKTLLIVADAKTLDTLAEAELPVNVPFTVHGNWFGKMAPVPPSSVTTTPVVPTPAPSPKTAHYNHPPCREDEEPLAIDQGHVICSPSCGAAFNYCPLDKPSGGTATPSCDSFVDKQLPQNKCVLHCTGIGSECPKGSACVKHGGGLSLGVCAYPVDGEMVLV